MKNKSILLTFAILLCSCKLLTAQNFITHWDLAIAGSGATQISFGVATSGTVSYTWETVPAASSGSGTFTGSTATITGLPVGSTIRLHVVPTNFQRININNGTDRNRLTQVENWGSTAWISMESAFHGCTNLEVSATDVPNLAGVSSMRYMFGFCPYLNSASNIGTWNTSNVNDMSNMFIEANAFDQNIGSWNTAAVTNMSGMFNGATVFNQNIGSWNTSSVTNMNVMFNSATAFNQNISSWNTASVEYMNYMFSVAGAFNQNIGSWNTAAVKEMGNMFSGAVSFNQNIGSWNTSAVTNMRAMFAYAFVFNQNIGNWNTGAVKDMGYMFYQAETFNQNIGNWNTAAVTNVGGDGMNSMFEGASVFNQNLGSWILNSTTSGESLFNMLNNCGMDCENYSSTLIGWNANPSTPNGISLGAVGRQYGSQSSAARANLVLSVGSGGKGWTITDGGASSGSCGAVANTVSTPTFTGTEFCAGATLNVGFTATGTYAGGNRFNVLLSDENGSFGAPQTIGTTTTTAGSVLCTIPSNATGGENYRIKVVSTNPVVSGSNNLNVIAVNPQNWNLVNPTNNVSSGSSTKKAIQILNAANSISGVAIVEYKAGNAINLTSGFQVVSAAGSSFKVNIGGCN